MVIIIIVGIHRIIVMIAPIKLVCFKLHVAKVIWPRRGAYGPERPDGCWWISTLGAMSVPPGRGTQSASCGCSSGVGSPAQRPARMCVPVSLLPVAPKGDFGDGRAGGTRRGRCGGCAGVGGATRTGRTGSRRKAAVYAQRIDPAVVSTTLAATELLLWVVLHGCIDNILNNA